MLRAVAFAARLDFAIEPTLLNAIRHHRREIAKSSPPRVLEEYYKMLRAGSSERAFRSLADVGLLEPTSPELQRGATDPLWRSLAALDKYRRRFESMPDTLTNPILLGSLLLPVEPHASGVDPMKQMPRWGTDPTALPRLGALPIARKDVERLRQILLLQRRLHDASASHRAQRGIAHRPIFRDALTWLDIHGGSPALVEHWASLTPEPGSPAPPDDRADGGAPTFKRRRRRRRRRKRVSPTQEH
jgi:tRNA nucleotidyltransferase/poly(A) polymerase